MGLEFFADCGFYLFNFTLSMYTLKFGALKVQTCFKSIENF